MKLINTIIISSTPPVSTEENILWVNGSSMYFCEGGKWNLLGGGGITDAKDLNAKLGDLNTNQQVVNDELLLMVQNFYKSWEKAY